MHLAVAAGRAQGQRLGQPGHVTVAVCGEGVTTTGVFHETLVLAVARDLPLVVVCKSQLWPEGAPAEAGVLGDGVAERARSAGVWARRADGADAVGTLLAVQAAVTRAREGSGPSLVEVIVTQLRHDPPAHRDPVERMRLYLDQQGQWSQTFQDVVEAEPRTRLDRAFKALGLGST
jgi:pyruvate dehydrogenase E1 component alpha subunit